MGRKKKVGRPKGSKNKPKKKSTKKKTKKKKSTQLTLAGKKTKTKKEDYHQTIKRHKLPIRTIKIDNEKPFRDIYIKMDRG